MKTILIPTDFSEHASYALELGVSISKRNGAHINLLHVHEVPGIGPHGSVDGTVDDIPYMIDLLKATRARMKKLTELFPDDVCFTHNIETGPVAHSILKAASKYMADLIIMGTQSAAGVRGLLIGSVAEKVIRSSPVPVLTLRGRFRKNSIEKIVLGTDFKSGFDPVYAKLLEVQDLTGGEINAVRIITRSEFESTKKTDRLIKQALNRHKKSPFKAEVYYDESKYLGIRRYAHSKEADIIALGTSSRTWLTKMFRGSLAEQLIRRSPVPVLTINQSLNLPESIPGTQEKISDAREALHETLFKIPAL